MKEIWKTIKGFKDYQISNLGRVKSFKNNKKIYLKPSKMKVGYYYINLRKNKTYLKPIHRLVSLAFIPNPENKPTVNHKDGNKLNNHINNLEWNTYSENNYHAYKLGLMNKIWANKYGKDHHCSKPVLQYSKSGCFIKRYAGQMEAKRDTGINNCDISSVCSGKRKSAGGFIWKYE